LEKTAQRTVDALGEGLGLPFLLLHFLSGSKENEEDITGSSLCHFLHFSICGTALPGLIIVPRNAGLPL
jgi:hypothetical protein